MTRKPTAGPLEAVSGGTQEGLEQEAAIRGAPGPGGTLALLRDVLYEEGYCALTLAGELLAPGGHSSAFCGADPLSTCWVCRAWDLVSSEQPARPAPPSPDSPSQGERKQQLLDQDRAPSARPLTYLASPYSHPDRTVRVARFEAANAAAGVLMALGHKVFSPISHTHPIAECCGLPLGWDFWEAFDRAYLSHCGRVIVLRSEGWEQSKGIAGELRIAVEMGIPVEYMDPAPPLGNAAIAALSSPSSASLESGGGTLETTK